VQETYIFQQENARNKAAPDSLPRTKNDSSNSLSHMGYNFNIQYPIPFMRGEAAPFARLRRSMEV